MKKLIFLSLLLGSTSLLGACSPDSPYYDFDAVDDTPTTGIEEGLDQMENEMEPSK